MFQRVADEVASGVLTDRTLVVPTLGDAAKPASSALNYDANGVWVVSAQKIQTDAVAPSSGPSLHMNGRGPARYSSWDGDPIYADALFQLSPQDRDGARVQHVQVIGPVRINVDAALAGLDLNSVNDVLLSKLAVVGGVRCLAVGARTKLLEPDGVTPLHSELVQIGGPAVQSSYLNGTRNCVEVTHGRNVTITNAILGGCGSAGRAADIVGAGLDVEPNRGQGVSTLTLTNCILRDNWGPGLALVASQNGWWPTEFTNFVFSGCQFLNNGLGHASGHPLYGHVWLQGGPVTATGGRVPGTARFDNCLFGALPIGQAAFVGHSTEGTWMGLSGSGNTFQCPKAINCDASGVL